MTNEQNSPLHEVSAPPPRRTPSPVFSWARDLVLSLIIAAVVVLFIYQPVQVEGTSMEPSLANHERVFINKFTYRLGIENIGRGDMVVFWFNNDHSKSYIKRVIGVPGDLVSIDNGVVYLNGRRLEESYVPPEYRDQRPLSPRVVAPGCYFVLGDHRISSYDSREMGQVERGWIYGKAVFVYWPLERIGRVH